MSKYHTTVSRRNFMKGLGLAGAGLGAAAATAPVFHDLDELSSSYTNFKYPWWIKEVDEPTVPLDWSLIDMRLPFSRYRTSNPTSANRKARMTASMKQGVEGSRLKDYALARSVTSVSPSREAAPWDGPKPYFDIADYGVAPHSGTPEENLHMVRAAMHYFGAPRLGCAEIDPSTNRKLYGSGIQWDSNEAIAHEDPVSGDKVIPKAAKYNLCWPVLQQPQISRNTKEPVVGGPIDGYPPFLGKASVYTGYSDVACIKFKLGKFLKNLGYQALNLGGLPVAFGPLQVAEYGRAGQACSPEFGMAIRKTDTLVTDLPLAETKPIDGGVHKFCEVCFRCGENCPSSSIDESSGPCSTPGELFSVDGTPINRNSGVLSWRVNWKGCVDYGAPVDCHICQWSCPFNHASDPSTIHKVVAASIGTTTIFNSFFANMDRFFDYATQRSADDWWNRDLSTWEHDTICGRGTGRPI